MEASGGARGATRHGAVDVEQPRVGLWPSEAGDAEP